MQTLTPSQRKEKSHRIDRVISGSLSCNTTPNFDVLLHYATIFRLPDTNLWLLSSFYSLNHPPTLSCLRPFSDRFVINIEQLHKPMNFPWRSSLHKHCCTGDSTNHILPNSEIGDDFIIGNPFQNMWPRSYLLQSSWVCVCCTQTHHRDIFPMIPLLSSFVLWEDNSKSHNRATLRKQGWIYCCNNWGSQRIFLKTENWQYLMNF